MCGSSLERRQFLKSASLAASASWLGMTAGLADHHEKKRKMTINLVCGAIGVRANQQQAIDLAAKHGFESVEASASELADLNEDAMQALLGDLKAKDLSWGTSGLSVEFRRDEDTFQKGLKALPKLAAGLQRAGVDRVSTYLMPSHAELTYLQNMKGHATRLREVAKVLKDHGQRLGMEYVGTQGLLTRGKYPFLHTLAETQELIGEIGTGNVGVVLDTWHWWTAGDSAEAIRALKNEEVILVDLNDAPKGVAKEDQQDNRRQLPLATGVIDVKSFLEALLAIGYDGPVRPEPFNQTLNDLDDDSACKASVEAMKKAFALIA